jgi:hypothetical protein
VHDHFSWAHSITAVDSSLAATSTNPISRTGVYSSLYNADGSRKYVRNADIHTPAPDSSVDYPIAASSVHTALADKQGTIHSSNRLDAVHVADGSVSSSEFQKLGSVETTPASGSTNLLTSDAVYTSS